MEVPGGKSWSVRFRITLFSRSQRREPMKGEKPGVFILFVLLAVVLVTSPVFSQPSKPTPPGAKPIKIGGSLPATGIWAESGKYVKDGYDFWLEDINKRGGLLGRPVQMIVYDDESSAEKAVSYYERAITIDKVDLVFGGYPGTTNVALMPLVEKYGKVFIGMGGMMKSFEQGFTYSFASPPLMSDWVYLALGGILDDLIPKAEWPKTIAILTMNSVVGLSARGNIIKAMEDREVKVVVDETYNLPLSDAAPLIGKAKEKGAEYLCCLSVFDDGVMIMRAAKAMNYNPRLIYQQTASLTPAWTKQLGKDGDNVTNTAFWHYRLPFPGNKEIREGVKALLGIPVPPMFFGSAYCWMKTLELAVQGARTLDNKKIRDYLRSHKFDLPYGLGITFDDRGLPAPFCFGGQTKGGRQELVWPKEVATTKFVYPRPAWSK
jgi:branched-chain amino acid transport system substrate-binding protein